MIQIHASSSTPPSQPYHSDHPSCFNRIVHSALNALKQWADAIGKTLTLAASKIGLLIPLHEETYLSLVQEKCRHLDFDTIIKKFKLIVLMKIDQQLLRDKFFAAFFQSYDDQRSLADTFDALNQRYPLFLEGFPSFLYSLFSTMTLKEFLEKLQCRNAELLYQLHDSMGKEPFQLHFGTMIEEMTLKEILSTFSGKIIGYGLLTKDEAKQRFQKEYTGKDLDTILKELDGWTFFQCGIADPERYRSQVLLTPVATSLERYDWNLFKYGILRPEDQSVKDYVQDLLDNTKELTSAFVTDIFPNLVTYNLIDAATRDEIQPFCERWEEIEDATSSEYTRLKCELAHAQAKSKYTTQTTFEARQERIMVYHRDPYGRRFRVPITRTTWQPKIEKKRNHTRDAQEHSLQEQLTAIQTEDYQNKHKEKKLLQEEWERRQRRGGYSPRTPL